LTIPSKLQSYMAFGNPIIGSIDGITYDLIIKSKSGLVSSSEDLNGLVDNIITLKNLSLDELNELGNNASKFYENNFSKNVVMSKLFEILG
jgi:glycosyltransferase involved in cell wall biosynthesis